MEIIPQLLLVILLVFLNGFFVASEFALVGVRKSRIEELVRMRKPAAKRVQAAIEDLETYISATQLGITLASLALGWIGEPAIAHLLEPLFSFLPQDAAFITAHSLAVIIAFTIISFLHIVLGELAPKSIALQKAEATSLLIVWPLMLFAKIFKPFIYILNGAGSLVLKLFGFTAPSAHQLVHSEEEIKIILAQSSQGGVIAKSEAEMVLNVFRLGEIPVKSIMIPRTDVVAFNVVTTLKETIYKMEQHMHSRFPVYERSIDNIIGFIHIKDVYKLALRSNSEKKLSEVNIIREIVHIPETKRADETLLDMRKRRTHMAVVNDEYGGTTGIVALEDIVERLVGEIQDEFDLPHKSFQKLQDNSFLVDGVVPIESVQKRFSLPIKGLGYTTIGGLMFGLLGHQPAIGDKVQIGNISMEVKELDRQRIKTVVIRKEQKKKTSGKK